MSPEENQSNMDFKQFKGIVKKKTLAENEKEIEAGIKCPWCFVAFDKPTGHKTVHAKCSIGWSDERLAKEGLKRYGT